MMHYAYPLFLIIGGVFVGLGLGFIAAAGNQSRLAFAVKEGAYIIVAGVVLLLLALAFFRP
jgi:hypothetical protein